jgi:hypothetical protein
MSDCSHDQIAITGGAVNVEETGLKNLHLSANCAACGEPMVFVGLPISALDGVPQIERAGRGAVLPILPFSAVYPEVVAAKAQMEQARAEADRPRIEVVGGGRPRGLN